jgi:hypothetical protein
VKPELVPMLTPKDAAAPRPKSPVSRPNKLACKLNKQWRKLNA